MKCYLLDEDDCNDGMPLPIVREISMLRTLAHPNIVKAYHVAVGPRVGDLYLLMEHVELVRLVCSLSTTPEFTSQS